jgi:hypothetical protein
MTREITDTERAMVDKMFPRDAVAHLFPKATPLDAQYDRAWDAILKSDELKLARSKLSIHELRLIIRAAITGKV